MLRLILVLYLTLISTQAFSCFAPYRGQGFDNLIKIRNLKEKNTYEVIVPKKARELDFGLSVSIAYSRPNEANPELKIPEEIIELEYVESGEVVIANFKIEKKDEYKPYIRVFWNPRMGGMCGAFGSSDFLKVE
jgi:hypothetical protein